MAGAESPAAPAPAVGALAFSIAPAPLAQALREFAIHAGITLSYAPALAAGKQSAGLQGQYQVEAGLLRLLAGTGLVARAQGNGDYVLEAASAGGAPTGNGTGGQGSLPVVQVQTTRASGWQREASAGARWSGSAADTPRTATLIPAELLHETGAASLAEALRTVPGVAFRGADAASAPAGDRPVIRGFDAASSVYVDGLRSTGPQGREIFAVEQVEVLEGPASVYAGRGAGGGSINLVSKQPRMQDATSASVGVGSAGYQRTTLDANRVLDEHTAARLNLMWQDSAKAGREQVSYRRWGVAPSITFGLDSPQRLSLSFYHLQSADMPDYSVPYVRGGGAPANVAGTPFLGLLARDYLDGSTDIAQLEASRPVGDGMRWRAITQYTHVRQSFIATNPQWDASGGDQLVLQAKSGIFDVESFIHQSELSGAVDGFGGQHSWLAGLELSRERAARNAFDIRDQSGASLGAGGSCAVLYNCTSFGSWNPGSPWTGTVAAPDGSLAVDTVTDSLALYAQDTWRVAPSWLLNGALRYDRFATRANGAGTGSSTALSNREGDWNYQLGAVYQPQAALSLYVSLSTSSNPVGADAGAGTDAITLSRRDLAPERARSLEAGFKLALRGEELSLNGSVFRTIKDNARISISRDTISGATQAVRGVELGLRGQLSADWKVFGGLALLDSHIDDGGTVPAYTGHAFPLTPRKSATLWTGYRLAPGWNAGLGATWNDRMYANASNTSFVPGYAKFDAMLSWQANARLTLQLNLYNLTDKRYYDTAYPVYATIAPRRWGTLTARMTY